MLRVMAADSTKRTMPKHLPSFLRLSLRVVMDCSQQNTVPRPKVRLVPALWTSSSLDHWNQEEVGVKNYTVNTWLPLWKVWS